MNEYIKRSTAMKIVDTPGYSKHDMLFALKTIPGITIPAADVRPVVRGEWDDKSVAFFLKCSKCGCCVGHRYDVFLDRGELNFCPNCGADMREES